MKKVYLEFVEKYPGDRIPEKRLVNNKSVFKTYKETKWIPAIVKAAGLPADFTTNCFRLNNEKFSTSEVIITSDIEKEIKDLLKINKGERLANLWRWNGIREKNGNYAVLEGGNNFDGRRGKMLIIDIS